MYDKAGEELGPIDYLIIVFPARTTSLAGAMATELASLVDAELIRVLDLVVVEKWADESFEVREFEDLWEGEALGDLRALEGQLAEVLALADLECVAASLEAGTTAAIVVLENTWAAPFASRGTPVRRTPCGGWPHPDARTRRRTRPGAKAAGRRI